MQTIGFIVNHPLNKQNKIKAVIRFAKWQIGSRLIQGDMIADWINGSKVVVRRGETGITGNIYCGLHEFSDMAFLLHVLRKDDLFVDIGANIGSYTILACSAIGASGYSIEPVPSTYARLMTNIKLNDLEERVTCLNIGLGDKDGQINFSSDQDTMNHVIADGEQVEHSIIVPVSTLDEMIKGSPSLIKIDVEGYETPVLKGAEKSLKDEALCSVIMELNGSGDRYKFDESKILHMMFDYGFRTYTYNPFKRELESLKGKNLSEGNTLFIRNKAHVLDRIMSAPSIEIHGMRI